jgi:LysR family transcriptional regulator of gallate degradation
MSFYLSLRHLRAFIVVAELGSVSKASESLFRAQSAVTRSIHELERALGVELFERKASGMLCTAFADAVLFRAKRAMQEFEQGIDETCSRSKRVRNAPQSGIPLVLFNERRLIAFIKLAESGHMPTVAKALGISQPAVSGSINELESNLGLVLFERTSKGMIATEAGALLAFRVKRALAELRHTEADLAALLGTTEGRVVIGALPLGRTMILPRSISDVLAQFPRLRFSTVEGAFDKLAAELRSGDIDFILGALRPADYAHDLTGEALLSDQMAVVVRAGHPLTLRERVTTDDLLAAQWVLSSPGTPSRTLFDLSFKSRGLVPPIEAVETSDLAILRGLLRDTNLVTAISAQQLRYEIDAGLLEVLDITLPNTSRVIGITQRAESHPSPGATALMAAIRRVAADISQHGDGALA